MLWNIRKVISKGDYNYAVVPEHPKADKHGYVLEHRVVVENILNRLLADNEVVHHINENKKDNRPENLEVMTTHSHVIHHQKTGRTYVVLTCANCGKEFSRELRQKHEYNQNHFCSRRCNGLYNGFKRK